MNNAGTSIALLAMVQKQIIEMGRGGCTGLIRVPDLVTPLVVAPGVGVPSEAAAPALKFNESGFVLALYGQERTGTPAKFAATEFQLMINGQRPIITSGEAGPAFFPLLGLFGPSVHWFPFLEYVEKGDLWQASFRNFDTAAVCNPTIGAAFLADAKLDQMAARLAGRR